MGQIVFEGDWGQDEVRAIAPILQKSLGIGDGESIPDELNPVAIEGQLFGLMSQRQKKLLAQLKQAGTAALSKSGDDEEDTPVEWSEYKDDSLKKALSPGSIRYGKDGKRFRLNNNRRWVRIDDDDAVGLGDVGPFQLPLEDGEFGTGIYLPVVGVPTGGVRLRIRLNFDPGELISDEQFYEMESDLTQDTDLMLDARGIKAIAQSEGDRVVLLCLRNPADVIPLGIVANSGVVPDGLPAFQIVSLTEHEDHLVADVEMVVQSSELQKSASTIRRTTLQSSSYLDGTKLRKVNAPLLDRALVRKAVDRCKLDGLDFSDLRVCLLAGVPDFLPMPIHGFCLPMDKTINLCPHDPQGAIAHLCGKLAERLQVAVRNNAIPGDTALEILARAARLSPDWWLEMIIKRYAGAIACYKFHIMDGEPSLPPLYMANLAARGLQFWGSRRAIAECAAEDFRCAHDPAGVPNMVTLEWDLALPSLARAGQQILLNALEEPNGPES